MTLHDLQKEVLRRFDLMWEPWPQSPFWKKDVNDTIEYGNKNIARIREFIEKEVFVAYLVGKDVAAEYIKKEITERGTYDMNYDDIYEQARTI